MVLVRLPVSLVAALLFTIAAPSASYAQAETTGIYSVNRAASMVGFTIHGSMIFKIKRDGQFKDFAGELLDDPARPVDTHMDLTVYTASVDMHDSENDMLMKSGDFFDVERFPTMHFTSSSTAINPDGTFAMTGDMTIRGITKRLTIPVKVRQALQAGTSSGAVFETTFPIDRTEFGLIGTPTWSGLKVSISKNVQIHIAIATVLNPSPFSR